MKGLEELLGFRITGSPDSCIDHRRIELLDSVTGNIKATRPATHQEVDLWNALQDHTFALEAANAGAREVADNNAQLLVDNRSLKASCNAYQEQLQKLFVFLGRIVPMHETSDAIISAMQLISTAYNVPLEPRYPDDPMNSMLLDQVGIMQSKVAGRPVRDNPQA